MAADILRQICYGIMLPTKLPSEEEHEDPWEIPGAHVNNTHTSKLHKNNTNVSDANSQHYRPLCTLLNKGNFPDLHVFLVSLLQALRQQLAHTIQSVCERVRVCEVASEALERNLETRRANGPEACLTLSNDSSQRGATSILFSVSDTVYSIC